MSAPDAAPLEARARLAIAAGYSVIPLTGKQPAGKWEAYQERLATTDELNRWFGGPNGRARNIGAVCGAVSHNLICFDFDEEGFFEAFMANVGPLADGVTLQRTGSGKMHAIMRSDAPVGGNRRLAWVQAPDEFTGRRIAIETRGEGGQFVIAPSIHPETGQPYEFTRGTLESTPVFPHAVVEFFLDVCAKLDEAPHTRQELEAVERRARPSRQHHDGASGDKGGVAVIRAYNDSVTIETVLERYGYKREGARYIRPGGTRQLVSILDDGHSFHHSAEDPLSDGHRHDAFDVYAYFEHGNDTRAAVRAAGDMLGMPLEERPARAPRREAPVAVGAAPDATTPRRGEAPDDGHLSDRWAGEHKLTAWVMENWHRYAAGVWQPVDEVLIENEIRGYVEAARVEGIKVSSGKLASVVRLARGRCARVATLFNADANLLVCQNGTLHIPTLELMPHSPLHYLTTGAPYDYDPQAQAPTWQYALKSSLAPDVVAFLQEFAGYAITTDTRHEIAVWLYGPPGSGKSTILEGLLAMLGERAALLGLADVERSRFSLTRIPGRTLLVATEQPSGLVAATDVLNKIVSGEPLTVERKYADQFELRSTAKIAWAMNELPRVADATNGIFRRVKVIRFTAREPGAMMPEVKELIRTEGAGILNWALEGLARLREHGRFEVPASVQGDSREFQERNDIPALFLHESGVLLGKDYRTKPTDLYNFYRQWCLDNGHRPQSSATVADDWLRLGLEAARTPSARYWVGVGLPAATGLFGV